MVAELRDGQLMVIEHFNGEDALDVFIIAEEGQRNRLTVAELLPEIVSITALRPLSALKDSRVDRYISRFKPDWMRELVLQDIRPYLPVMIAAFLINVLSLAGIIFSMQVYDRVIPAQSYPTLYVLSTGVLVAVLFGFLLREARAGTGSRDDHLLDPVDDCRSTVFLFVYRGAGLYRPALGVDSPRRGPADDPAWFAVTEETGGARQPGSA